MQVGHLAFALCEDRNTGKPQALVETRDVREVTTQAIQGFSQDYVELPSAGVRIQASEFRPERTTPALSGVRIDTDDFPAAILGVPPAIPDLIVD